MRPSAQGSGPPVESRWRPGGASGDAHDEERDRDVLAGHRDDRERVEELVVTEHAWSGIRLAEGVDDGADGVGEAADEQERDRRGVEPSDELRQHDYRDPAER